MSDYICSFDHPIVFLFDYSNDSVSVPDYDETSVTASNGGCISIRVSSYVDGEVRIRLIKDSEVNASALDPVKVFEGKISAPNRGVSLVNSLNEELGSIKLESEEASIRVYVDDEALPTAVTIVVSN